MLTGSAGRCRRDTGNTPDEGSRCRGGLPRFALTGFDHGCFFVGGLAQYGNAFTGSKGQVAYKSVQTPLHFKQVGKGYKNANFMFVHYLTTGNIEAINY